MAKIAIATLGCKVNQYDSAGISEALANRGHAIVPFDQAADIYIVNTCTVTGKTDYQSRQLIRRANRLNPSAEIIVTGCYAQTSPRVLAELPGVSRVLGSYEKVLIPDILEKVLKARPEISVNGLSSNGGFHSLPVTVFQGHTRAYLKVQEGCDSFCSYCIIPYARGKSRSLCIESALERLNILAKSGHKEVVLTGIHLGKYGRDQSPECSLVELLNCIEETSDIKRVRISSIEPLEITDELVAFMKTSRVMCHHLHIPLQSGDDSVLSMMNRNYTVDRFYNIIEMLVETIPDIGIGLDVMVGFPGETEEMFNNTRTFLEMLPVSYLHVFPYSARPGTKAASFPGQVNENVKKQRAKLLRDMGIRKREDFNRRFMERPLRVLMEQAPRGRTGLFKGFSDNYIPVFVEEAKENLRNRIVTVLPHKLVENGVIGKYIP